MSAEVRKATCDLRSLMFDRIYINSLAKREESKAEHVIEQLYTYYVRYPEQLPLQSLKIMESSKDSLEQTVCDYIAGMTDNYAVRKFKELFVPGAWVDPEDRHFGTIHDFN